MDETAPTHTLSLRIVKAMIAALLAVAPTQVAQSRRAPSDPAQVAQNPTTDGPTTDEPPRGPAPGTHDEGVRRALVRISVVLPGIGMETLTEGAGFAVADDLVVTAFHVIHGATRAALVLEENDPAPITEVVAVDEALDLAVLRADVPPGTLSPLSLAEGFPPEGAAATLPVLEHLSDETDSIEGEPRRLLWRDGHALGTASFTSGDLVRLEMPTMHGDSGSPILDPASRRVIGVASMIDVYDETDRVVTYAIPADAVRALLERSRGAPPVARPFGALHRAYLLDPRVMIGAAQELVLYRENDLARTILEYVMANGDKLSAPIPREGRWLQAWLEWVDTDEDDLVALEQVEASLLTALDAPARSLADEAVTPDCWHLLGEVQDLLGRAEARRSHEEAVRLRPDHVDALHALAVIAIDGGHELAFRRRVRELRAVLGPDAPCLADLRERWSER